MTTLQQIPNIDRRRLRDAQIADALRAGLSTTRVATRFNVSASHVREVAIRTGVRAKQEPNNARHTPDDVWRAVLEIVAVTGAPVTLRELMRHMDMSSTAVARYHVERLRDTGRLVVVEASRARSARAIMPAELAELLRRRAQEILEASTGDNA